MLSFCQPLYHIKAFLLVFIALCECTNNPNNEHVNKKEQVQVLLLITAIPVVCQGAQRGQDEGCMQGEIILSSAPPRPPL